VADISNPAKDWELHRQWTSRIMEEFFCQVCDLTVFLSFRRFCFSFRGFLGFLLFPTANTNFTFLKLRYTLLHLAKFSLAGGLVACMKNWSEFSEK